MALQDRTPAPGATAWGGPWPPGWTVRHVATTASTNADLLADDRSSPDRIRHRSVLVADHQSAGRGRLDRRWEAPPCTNLLASLLFRAEASGGADLPRRVSLAALDACRRAAPGVATPGSLRLKWPNDLLLHGAKLAGVLAESRPGLVVVGIGINVEWCPPGAARLGGGVDRAELLAGMLHAFDQLPGPPSELAARHRAELATIGQEVRVEVPGGDLVGRALDVDADGRLVLLDRCGLTHRLAVGDVVHVRPA